MKSRINLTFGTTALVVVALLAIAFLFGVKVQTYLVQKRQTDPIAMGVQQVIDLKHSCTSSVDKYMNEAFLQTNIAPYLDGYSIDHSGYSEKRNSCLVAFSYTAQPPAHWTWRIVDVLSNESIYDETYFVGQTNKKSKEVIEKEYNDLIEEIF